jgi:hypothetical protein
MNSFGVFWVFLKEKTDDSFHLRRGAEQKYPGTIVITPSCTNVPVGLGNRSNYVKQVSNKEGDFIIINSPPPTKFFFLFSSSKRKRKKKILLFYAAHKSFNEGDKTFWSDTLLLINNQR